MIRRLMRVVTAPDSLDPKLPEYLRTESIPRIFLAGGITGCCDWQKSLIQKLDHLRVIVLNPRRADFPINDPSAAQAQIEWEFKMLREADGISFWFAPETLQPIGLYELGAWSMTKKPLLVGVDPNYARKQDVEIQTRLARLGDVAVVVGWDAFVDHWVRWVGFLSRSVGE